MTRAHELSKLAKEKLFEVFDSFSEDTASEDAVEANDSEKCGEGESEGTKKPS